MNKWAAWAGTVVATVGISTVAACFIIAVWVNPDMTPTAKWAVTGLIPLAPCAALAVILSFIWEDVGLSALERKVKDLQEQRDYWRAKATGENK